MTNPTLYIARFREGGDEEPPVDLTYDEYCSGDGDMDALDFWWKLDTDFSGSVEANFGAGGAAALTLRGSGVGLNLQEPGIVNTTADELALELTGASFTWLNAATVLVDGTEPFTCGGWFNVPTAAEDQLLIRTNMGGTQGYWRGIDVLYQDGTDYLVIVLGTNSAAGSKFYYRLVTNVGIMDREAINMVALYVDPTTDPLTIGLSLYVNGVLQSLAYTSGTGDTIAWPVTASSPDAYNGIAFGAAGDTYGGKAAWVADEVFFHWGEITASQIATMYALGTQV